MESGGDNLSATFSPALSDLTLYVIDVSAGDKIPRKGGPGITKSDLLIINKTDLAPLVGAAQQQRAEIGGQGALILFDITDSEALTILLDHGLVFVLMLFPEGFSNGAIATVLTVLWPDMLKTYRDDWYLKG